MKNLHQHFVDQKILHHYFGAATSGKTKTKINNEEKRQTSRKEEQ